MSEGGDSVEYILLRVLSTLRVSLLCISCSALGVGVGGAPMGLRSNLIGSDNELSARGAGTAVPAWGAWTVGRSI